MQDLASVLDLTTKAVRERIAYLQSYHLLATTVRGSTDTTIYVPSDLVSVKEILKNYLGQQARSVEEACASAEERSRSSTKSIGLAIRTIIGLWKEDRAGEAVIAAKKLHSQHPANGDVACMYGAALMRVKPYRTKEADIAFEEARRFNCLRPELPSYIIQTKTELEDWPGLYMLTKALSSNEAHRDIWLDAFITACRGLIATAKIRGDWKRVADLALEVVERISFKLQRQTVTANYLQTLLGWRFDLAREHFDATARYISSYGDQINLFDATIRLAEYDVLLSDLIRRGVGALSIWWSGVEARPVIDETARGILSKQLRRLNSLEKQLSKLGKPQTETLGAIQEVSHDLAFRGAKYGRAA